MTKTITQLLIGLVGLFSLQVNAQETKDVVVRTWAEVTSNPASITLKWESSHPTNNVVIQKKGKDDWSWQALTTTTGNPGTYTDNNVQVGKAYEYRLTQSQGSYSAIGYVYAGIQLDKQDWKGRLLWVIASNVYDSLKTEIEAAIADHVGDGWQTDTVVVPVSWKDVQVKSKINAWANVSPISAKAVFIFGHVAVPYSGQMISSGDYPADGHTPDHEGAWVADGFYADLDGTYTDVQVNTNPTREANKNRAGDGKWDQSVFPSAPELEIARVDMYDLPTFGKTEIELLRQYLNKLKAYKSNSWKVPRRGLIDDRLGFFGGEAPARSGWSNMSPFFKPNQIAAGNYFDSGKARPYLMAHESSTGGYTVYINVGDVNRYKDSIKIVFSSSFGSYFGDWDITNNILRGCLASPGYTLTNCWNGRPSFWMHHMGLGEHIGFSTKLTQSNGVDIFTYAYPVLFAAARMHISTMGDPTLRLHMMNKVTGLTGTASGDKKSATINWTASTENGVIGYHVYRSNTMNGLFEKINSALVTTTSFTDNTPSNGTNIYMVRAVKLENTASGIYYNQSIGTFVTVPNLIGLGAKDITMEALSIYPNPAHQYTTVQPDIKLAGTGSWQLNNMLGQEVASGTYETITGKFRLDLNQLEPSMYLLTISKNGLTQSTQIVVTR